MPENDAEQSVFSSPTSSQPAFQACFSFDSWRTCESSGRALLDGSPPPSGYGTVRQLLESVASQHIHHRTQHLCAQVIKSSESARSACEDCESRWLAEVQQTGNVARDRCHAGLYHALYPVKVNDKVVDVLAVGRLLVEAKDRATLEQAAVRAGMDAQEAKALAAEIPVTDTATLETLEQQVRHTQQLAQQLIEQQKLLSLSHNSFEQQARLAAVGQMVSGVSHELNNRLTPVLGYVDMLELEDLSEEGKQYLATVQEAVLGTRTVIESLLNFATPPSPKWRVIDAAGVVESALRLVEYALRVDGIQVSFNAEEQLPPLVGDGPLLQQVLLNLFSNARLAMPHGGKIWVDIRHRDKHMCISVKDNGCGMNEETRTRAFEPFFTTRPVGEGMGLGLSSCFGIVHAHGGNIEVESEPDKGSTFTIKLPVHMEFEAAAKPEESTDVTTADALPRMSVLVVDDEHYVQQLLIDLLRDRHEVQVCGSVAQARHIIQRRRNFDAVLLDLRLSDGSGLTLLHEMEQQYPELLAATMVITANKNDSVALEGVKRTGRPVLAKPFLPNELYQHLMALARAHGLDSRTPPEA